MVESKIVIFGKVVKIAGNKIYVRRGDTLDIYNADYYRVLPWRG